MSKRILSAEVPTDTADRLRSLAQQRGISLSSVIREALTSYITVGAPR